TTVQTADYDPYGHPLTVTDAAGNSTTMHYNALGRLDETVGPVHLVAPLTANDEQAVDPFRDQLPQTLVTTLTLDPFGRIRQQTNSAAEGEDARLLIHEYDVRGNLVADTDPEGNLTRRGYDPLGRVIRETRAIHADLGPLGVNEEGLEQRYVYDALGRRTHTLDVYLDGDDQVQTGKSAVYNA